MAKLKKIASTINSIRTADNPAQAAGNLAAGAAMVAHPIAGTLAAPLIRKGVEKAVTRGMEIAKDPAVQERVKSGVRDIGSNISGRVAHLRDGMSNGGTDVG